MVCLYKVADVTEVLCVQDMTSRELLQQRTTLDSGDTSWRLSPLVEAALKGRLAVLDGMHRVDTATLAVLKRYMFMQLCIYLDTKG